MKIESKLTRWVDKYLIAIILDFARPFILPKRQNEELCVRRILAIKFPGLGNIAMILPLIRELKASFPDSHLTFLTLKRNKEILNGIEFINEKLFLDTSNVWRGLTSLCKIIIHLKKSRFNVVFDFDQFLQISAFLTILSGAKVRIGFETKGLRRDRAYTHRVIYTNNCHMREEFRKVLNAYQVFPKDIDHFNFSIMDCEKLKVIELLQTNRIEADIFLTLVFPGSGPNFLERRWPLERYISLCDKLIHYCHGALKVILVGAREEMNLAGRLERSINSEMLNLTGLLSIRESIYLIEKAHLLIANDTAAVHIANSVGTPVCAFYGPNSPLLYGPRGARDIYFYNRLECSPCITNYNQKFSLCRHAVCMVSIQVENVYKVIKEKWLDPFLQKLGKCEGRAISYQR